jgi:hypothetical protein
MMSRMVLGVLVGMAGCATAPLAQNEDADTANAPEAVTFDGTAFFPMDGERTWVFKTPVLPYRLVGHKPMEPVSPGIYEITFTPDCLGSADPCGTDSNTNGLHDFEEQPLFTWRMSSDEAGTAFHALDSTAFDPPVKLAGRRQPEEEALVTYSGGVSYRATVLTARPCDVEYWLDTPPEGCRVFRLNDGGAKSALVGEYMAVPEYGIVWFHQGSPDGAGVPAPTWEMTSYEYIRP